MVLGSFKQSAPSEEHRASQVFFTINPIVEYPIIKVVFKLLKELPGCVLVSDISFNIKIILDFEYYIFLILLNHLVFFIWNIIDLISYYKYNM